MRCDVTRDEKKAAGICAQSGCHSPAQPKRTMCEPCAEAHRARCLAYNKAHPAKRKNGAYRVPSFDDFERLTGE